MKTGSFLFAKTSWERYLIPLEKLSKKFRSPTLHFSCPTSKELVLVLIMLYQPSYYYNYKIYFAMCIQSTKGHIHLPQCQHPRVGVFWDQSVHMKRWGDHWPWYRHDGDVGSEHHSLPLSHWYLIKWDNNHNVITSKSGHAVKSRNWLPIHLLINQLSMYQPRR